jgi:iron complex outermembrane receptor protein
LLTALCGLHPSAVRAAEGDAQDEAPAPVEEPVARDSDTDVQGVLRETPTEGVEEITITGEVLESTTQAEPEAITTFDQEELDTLGIATVDSLALNTPSLHVGQVGQQAVITLRGIGLENLTSIGEAGVGFEIDGVHIGRPSGSNATFFDVERVDVLRGPQGYKGGRNLTAGRIALYSKKPTEDLDAAFDVTYGNYDHIQTRGILNIPIYEDKLMTRTSVIFDRRDGFQDNLFTGVVGTNADDSKDVAARFQTRSLFFDQSLEARTILTYSQQKGNGPAAKLIGAPPERVANPVSLVLANPDARDRLLRYEELTPAEAAGDPLAYATNDGKFIKSTCEPAHPGYAGFDDDVKRNTQQWVCNPGDPRETLANQIHTRDNNQRGFTGHLTWDVPFWSDSVMSDIRLGLVGSVQNLLADNATDFDATNIPHTYFDLERESDQTQVEFFIERADVDFFDFKVGVFYFEETVNTEVCFDASGQQLFGDIGISTEVFTESLAGYATVGFRPLDSVRIFGGTRYLQETKASDQILEEWDNDGSPLSLGGTKASQENCPNRNFTIINGSPNPNRFIKPAISGACPNGIGECLTFEEDYEAWTPAFGIDWQLTDASSLSFSAVKGWKAGGFALGASSQLTSDVLDQPYDSEEVWSFELTSKNELFHGLARVNATLFWTEYDPFQICQFSGPVFFCRSDGGATIRGVELEWLANPVASLQLNGHFNFIDSKINNFEVFDPADRRCEFHPTPQLRQRCDAGLIAPTSPPGVRIPTDVSGNQLSRSPSWAGSLGVQYTLDFGRWGFFTPRAQTQFQGKTYFRVFNREEFSQEPFAKLDVKLMWRSESDRYKAEIFAVNLTDEDVINSMIVGPVQSGGQILAQYQPPRVIGVQFGVNYLSDLFDDWF